MKKLFLNHTTTALAIALICTAFLIIADPLNVREKAELTSSDEYLGITAKENTESLAPTTEKDIEQNAPINLEPAYTPQTNNAPTQNTVQRRSGGGGSSGSSGESSPAPTPVHKVNLKPGQEASLSVDEMTISFPEDTIDEELEIVAEKAETDSSVGNVLIKEAFTFSPEGTEFDEPGKITFHYDKNDFTDEANAAIYYLNNGKWELQTETEQDLDANTLTLPINHFSTFGLGETLPATNTIPFPECDTEYCDYTIYLQSRIVAIEDGYVDPEIISIENLPAENYFIYAYIQTYSPLTEEDKAELRLKRLVIEDNFYVPKNMYRIRYAHKYASEKDLSEFIDDPRIRAIISILPQDTLDRNIYDYETNTFNNEKLEEAKQANGYYQFEIRFEGSPENSDTHTGFSQVWNFVDGEGALVDQDIWDGDIMVIFQTTPELAVEIAKLGIVRWVGLLPNNFALALDEAKIDIGKVELENTYPDLTGTGTTIGQLEVAWPNEISNLEGRISYILSEDTLPTDGAITHATMVAAIAAGGPRIGPGRRAYGGIATEANIIAGRLNPGFDGSLLIDYLILDRFGADVIMNPWIDGSISYSIISREIDIYARNLPIITASGNLRGNPIICGSEDDEYYCLLSSAQAKNAIVVGASLSSSDEIWEASGVGPTQDNRLKPDIVAPGCQIGNDEGITTPTENTFETLCASSLATPMVAGTIALMKQARAEQGSPDFMPATYKAIIMQTAADISVIGPDFESGYGELNTFDAVDFVIENPPTEETIFEDIITTDNYIQAWITNDLSAAEEVKMTLVWNDLPGEPFAARALINDLDLSVMTPTGDIIRPWRASYPLDDAYRNQDHINNVEQISFTVEESGVYEVRVSTSSLPGMTQDFTLVSDIPLTPQTCIEPYDDLIVTGNTFLCPGEYSIQDVNSDGVIQLIGSGTGTFPRLSCLGTSLVSPTTSGASKGISVLHPGSKVYGCIMQNYALGISFTPEIGVFGERSIIANNGVNNAVAYGIYAGRLQGNPISYASQLTIYNNNLKNVGRGIYVDVEGPVTGIGSGAEITDNVIQETTYHGIEVVGDYNLIDNNVLLDIGFVGIILEDAAITPITNNRIERSGTIGILLGPNIGDADSVLGLEVENNAILWSGREGVKLRSGLNDPNTANFNDNIACYSGQSVTNPNIITNDVSISVSGQWEFDNNRCDISNSVSMCEFSCLPNIGTDERWIGIEVSSDWSSSRRQPENVPIAFNMIGGNLPPSGTYTLVWDFGDGTIVYGEDPTSHTYAELGRYTVTVTLAGIDSPFSYGSASQLMIIENFDPEIIEFQATTPTIINEGESVIFQYTVEANEPDTTASMEITDQSGITTTINGLDVDFPGAVWEQPFLEPGVYDVVLVAEDANSVIPSEEITIIVISNLARIDYTMEYIGIEGIQVVTYTLTDIDESITLPVSYTWSFYYEGAEYAPEFYDDMPTTSTEATPIVVYGPIGSYLVEVSIIDSNDQSYGPFFTDINIPNRIPQRILFEQGNEDLIFNPYPAPPEPICAPFTTTLTIPMFEEIDSRVGNAPIEYIWRFALGGVTDDEFTTEEPTITYTFDNPGIWDILSEVSDSDNDIWSNSIDFEIDDCGEPPSIFIDMPPGPLPVLGDIHFWYTIAAGNFPLTMTITASYEGAPSFTNIVNEPISNDMYSFEPFISEDIIQGDYELIVTLEDANGQITTFTEDFAIGPSSPPYIYRVDENSAVTGWQPTGVWRQGYTISDTLFSGLPLTYSWIFPDNDIVVGSESDSPSVFEGILGTYSGTITVTDELGGSFSLPVTWEVPDAQLAINMNEEFSDSLGIVNQDLQFMVERGTTIETSGNFPVMYDWNFGDGESIIDGPSVVSHAYAAPGVYIITVTAQDSDGDAAIATWEVTITDDSSPPVGNAPPPNVFVEDEVELTFDVPLESAATMSVSIQGVDNQDDTEGFLFGYDIIPSDDDAVGYIRIYYDESLLNGLDESTLKLYYWNERSERWKPLRHTGVNTEENYVFGFAPHFSIFGAIGNFTDADNDTFDVRYDCLDNNSAVHPNATEIPYDQLDNDCNNATPDDDVDFDGFVIALDCNDNNAAVNPDAEEEVYDGIDNDCNNATLDDDLDQDGYGFRVDCRDNNPDINPGETEIPYDGLDNDCNGRTWDDDLDRDGFLLATDCNDEDAAISPNATEIHCDDIDQNCNGLEDDDLDEDEDNVSECDNEDNCIGTYNPDQSDIDEDEAGDACDFTIEALEGWLWVTPETLNVNPGTMTVHTAFPAPFDNVTINNATLDGAPMDRVAGSNVKFERQTIADYLESIGELLDVYFDIVGSLTYNGLEYTFVGEDSISEILNDDPGNGNKGNGNNGNGNN